MSFPRTRHNDNVFSSFVRRLFAQPFTGSFAVQRQMSSSLSCLPQDVCLAIDMKPTRSSYLTPVLSFSSYTPTQPKVCLSHAYFMQGVLVRCNCKTRPNFRRIRSPTRDGSRGRATRNLFRCKNLILPQVGTHSQFHFGDGSKSKQFKLLLLQTG